MKIQYLIENEIKPSQLPSNISWYHCGPEFEQFSTAFLGGGENNHLLGYGIYFINSTHIAKGYAKYVRRGDPILYEVHLNAPGDEFYCNRNKPSDDQAKAMNEIAKLLGYENYQSVKYNHSAMKYGRGLVGAVFEKFGAQKGAQILTTNGIRGQFEEVDDGVYELAVWDTSIIKIVSKERLPGNPPAPPSEPNPDLDAWWEEMMNGKKPS